MFKNWARPRINESIYGSRERRMRRSAVRLLSLMVTAIFLSAPALSALAAGGGDPSPPPSSSDSGKKKKGKKTSAMKKQRFADGYRAAYATIYDRHDFASAIEQLKALGHEDRADVANLIGYSYRKLGDYKVSQIWYERALKADPNHVRTWQYYGLWQIEQGNRDQAQYHLGRIA